MSRDLTLKVEMRDITNSEAKLISDIVELPMDEAVELVMSGEAKLHLEQIIPPFGMMEKVPGRGEKSRVTRNYI